MLSARRGLIALALLVMSLSCAASAPRLSLPPQVYVALVNDSSSEGFVWANSFCSGVLVAPRLVVTASHCVNEGNLPDVYVGERDLCHPGGAGERVQVSRMVVGSGVSKELAALVLASTATYVPLEVLPAGASPGRSVATGWGRLDAVTRRPCLGKAVLLREVPSSACRGTIESARTMGAAPSSYACMVPEAGGLNTCVGDSGGGVYDMSGALPRVAGVTLGGGGCGATDVGVYASPDAVRAMLELSGMIGPGQ